MRISNKARGWGPKSVPVFSSGEFEKSVKLAIGKNLIVVESRDQAGNAPTAQVQVTRKDGRPVIKSFKLTPGKIKKSALPRSVTVTVVVVDSRGAVMPGATVVFSRAAAGYPAEGSTEVTGSKGQAKWTTNLARTDSLATEIPVTVTITSPTGQETDDTKSIEIS